MKLRSSGVLQIAFLLGFCFLLLRLFPFLIRLGEGAAVSIQRFGWVVLLLALAGWLIWVLRKRN
jgi:hypothetical protein